MSHNFNIESFKTGEPNTCLYCKNILIPLYKSIVRSQLKYASQFVFFFQRDKTALEKIQHVDTKLISELANKFKNKRLKTK